MELDLESPLTSFKEHEIHNVSALFANESDHMPSLAFKTGDFGDSVRRHCISLVSQFSGHFDPSIHYLAINYMDRFISKREMPRGKPWILNLLVISCLSLAAKMKDADLSVLELQREKGFAFDAHSIHRMELLILTCLNWRMRSVTPFCFLHYFLSLCQLEDQHLAQALKDRASEIILKAHNEMEVLEYKPSLIAASSLLCACGELLPVGYQCLETAISSCEYVNEDEMVKCLGVIRRRGMGGSESV